jgi:hypothetical protein
MKVLVFKDIKNNRWTLWSLDRKTHLGYRNNLTLKDCKFVVEESKRQKVLKTKKRFPHAWVIGTTTRFSTVPKKSVSYNPFTSSSFMSGKQKVLSSKMASFTTDGKVFKK